MKRAGLYYRNAELLGYDGVREMLLKLADGGMEVYMIDADEASSVDDPSRMLDGIDVLIAVGGDGTFLSAANFAAAAGVPLVGVNLGRLGFLSENRPADVAAALVDGDFSIEERAMLRGLCRVSGSENEEFALNEVSVHRSASILGVELSLNGTALPTYWADGLLVATASGSTAYSLSAGGPIVLPDSKVLIVTPIAPHNLNVRPLVVPDTSVISMRFLSRDGEVVLTADNRTMTVPSDAELTVALAQFSLKRIRLNSSNFINALIAKLHWGDDVRNGKQ